MALDTGLLTQALRISEAQDVLSSPVVTAVVLRDPSNAADLVPALERYDSLEARNAHRILSQFELNAVPYLVIALLDAQIEARKAGFEALWALLAGEPDWRVRDALEGIAPALGKLLDDKRLTPDHLPPYVERDFRGQRLCDTLFVLLQETLDPGYDQSAFRSLDDDGRDQEIAGLKRRGFRLPTA